MLSKRIAASHGADGTGVFCGQLLPSRQEFGRHVCRADCWARSNVSVSMIGSCTPHPLVPVVQPHPGLVSQGEVIDIDEDFVFALFVPHLQPGIAGGWTGSPGPWPWTTPHPSGDGSVQDRSRGRRNIAKGQHLRDRENPSTTGISQTRRLHVRRECHAICDTNSLPDLSLRTVVTAGR